VRRETPQKRLMAKVRIAAKPGKHVIAAKERTRRLTTDFTAERFVRRLEAHRWPEQIQQYGRYLKFDNGEHSDRDGFVGVRMRHVFDLAKEFIEMAPGEIERLLENPIHEVWWVRSALWTNRLGAGRHLVRKGF
jgi:hypothetical protein